MPLPARLVLLRAAVVVEGEQHRAALAGGGAEVDRRLAAVAADLEHRRRHRRARATAASWRASPSSGGMKPRAASAAARSAGSIGTVQSAGQRVAQLLVGRVVLVDLDVEQPVEDEEAQHPQDAEGEQLAMSRMATVVSVCSSAQSVVQPDDVDRTRPATAKHPERQHLLLAVALAASCPRPRPGSGSRPAPRRCDAARCWRRSAAIQCVDGMTSSPPTDEHVHHRDRHVAQALGADQPEDVGHDPGVGGGVAAGTAAGVQCSSRDLDARSGAGPLGPSNQAILPPPVGPIGVMGTVRRHPERHRARRPGRTPVRGAGPVAPAGPAMWEIWACPRPPSTTSSPCSTSRRSR